MGTVSKDRYKGCLIGAAIGDALGAPLEMMSKEEIFRTYGRIDKFVRATASHQNRYLIPGQYTDDTQLTLALAKSIIDRKGFSPENFAGKLIAWYEGSDKRSAGKATLKACKALSKGIPYDRSGVKGSMGNGTAMRASPLGLFYSLSPNQPLSRNFAKACHDSTIITHDDSRAVAATAAIARSVLYLKGAEGEFNVEDFLTQVIGFTEFVETHEEKIRGNRISDNLTTRLHNLLNLKNTSFERGAREIGNSSLVLESVPLAIFSFLKSPESFETAVENAANSGGDADTIASMAGALSGAYNGLNKIPERYKESLESLSEITSIANKLFEAAFEKGHIHREEDDRDKTVYTSD